MTVSGKRLQTTPIARLAGSCWDVLLVGRRLGGAASPSKPPQPPGWPGLAGKGGLVTSSTEPTGDHIREFVLAGHGNLARVKEMLAAEPALLNAAYEWAANDHETAIQAAAHVGNSAIAEYLLAQGAPLDICTAAMLGRQGEVEELIAGDPDQIGAKGAHGVTFLIHET